MANISAQQKLVLEQQMAALRPNAMREPSNIQGFSIEQRMIMQMDGVDVPQRYINHPSMPRSIPPDITKWGQLKQWASINPTLGLDELESVKNLQTHHYSSIIQTRAPLENQNSAGMAQVEQQRRMIQTQAQAQEQLQQEPAQMMTTAQLQAMRGGPMTRLVNLPKHLQWQQQQGVKKGPQQQQEQRSQATANTKEMIRATLRQQTRSLNRWQSEVLLEERVSLVFEV
jgi:hypothetical protein